ncbi:MAG: CAP domain-containing protein [Myxococcales bacterium]
MRDLRVFALLALLSSCSHGQGAGPIKAAGQPQARPAADPSASVTARGFFETASPKGSILLVEGATDAKPLEDALAKACRKAGLKADPRLAELSMSVARQSDGGRLAPRGAYVGYVSHQLGLVEPTPQLWLAGASRAEMLLPSIDPAVQDAVHSMAVTHCGGALLKQGQASVLAVAFSGRFVELERPIPQQVDVGSSLQLAASLPRGYAHPSLAITDPEGLATRLPLPDARVINQTITLASPGTHSIEILAEGPSGLGVLAVIPVQAGTGAEQAAPAYEEGPAETDVASFVEKLSALIAEARAARKLPPLKVDRRLVRVAQAHTEDMDAHHFVAHTSKTTGEASDRVERAGLKAQVLLENIGRGYSANEIHEGLMASPGHRANVLHPEARSMGLGVVIQPEGDRVAFLVTELFAKLLN